MSEAEIKQVEKEVKVEKKVSAKNGNDKVAVVLVRGMVNMNDGIKKTLALLNLTRKNNCVVITDNPVNMGMVKKVKDYVTWGSVSEETFKELVNKRGKEKTTRLTDSKKKYSYNALEINGKKYSPTFPLNPPKKGFGRKGIKVAFKVGGALGDRGEKINDLIKRMI